MARGTKIPQIGLYKSALEWGQAKINDPTFPDELKVKVAQIIIPFQCRRLESIRAPGPRALAAEAAKETKPHYEPGSPPPALMLVPRREDGETEN